MFYRNHFVHVLRVGFLSLILSVVSSFLYVLPSYASFSLDPTYGNGGKVITSFGNYSDAASVALQSDGKAVAVGVNHNGGHYNWAIARYNTNGTLDTSFGSNGTVTQDFGMDNRALGVAIQPTDGKIVVGGAFTASNSNGVGWTVGRYNTDGSLDTSFGNNGIVSTPIYQGQLLGLALQSDGKIVTVGYDGATNGSTNHLVVVRYNPDGTLDGTFGSGGIVSTLVGGSSFDRGRAVAIQPTDGKIVIFGDLSFGGNGSIFTTRLNPDGSLDPSFGSNGSVIEQVGNSDAGLALTLQSDGKIVVTGGFSGLASGNATLVIRYNTDGTHDTSFASNGVYTNTFGANNSLGDSIVIQIDGKIIIGGVNETNFALRRFNTDGTLDNGFGTNGSIVTPITSSYNQINDLALQSDGKILAAGQASNGSYDDWALARYADITNNPPTVNPISNANINEGDTYTASGSFTDSDSTSWTATVDYGDGGGAQSLTLSGMNFSLSHVYKDNGTYTVTVSVTDNQGATGTGTATITVNNVNPSVGTITAPASPVQVNTAITASANFTDPGVLDTHTASWNWGDGNTTTGTVTETNGSGSVSNNHTYTATGVYTITLTVTDKDGGVGTSTYQYVAVYDSNTSFAGGRSFDNPTSASPNTTGKVSFGISAKYSNSNTLTGNAKMDFKAASIDFASTSLSSLATSNGRAYLKGNGTVNGSGNYTFLATGIDGSVAGGNDLIRFQIKDSSNNVIYDSQPGAGDTTDPTTPDATGNIRVH